MELPKDANFQEILKALGLAQPPDHDLLGKLSLFGAGLLVGAGVALLLTPRSEHEEPASEDEEPASESQGVGVQPDAV
jgi:hypothetical protein